MGDEKPTIELTSWLNSVTNLPLLWQSIIEEVLTNRYGVFKYNYDGAKTKKNNEGEIIYSKPYNIDLTIIIDKTYTDDEAIQINERAINQIHKCMLIHAILKVFDKNYMDNSLSLHIAIKEIMNLLKDINENPEKLDELYSKLKEDFEQFNKENL